MLGLRSVRLRLTLWYVVLLAFILAGFSAGVYLTLRHNLHANLDDTLETRVGELLPFVVYDANRPMLSGGKSNLDLAEQFVRIYDSSGQLTFNNGGEEGTSPMDMQRVQLALSGEAVTSGSDVRGEPFRVRTVPIMRQGEVAGVLEAGSAADDAAETLTALLIILSVAYPATLATASLGGIFLAGRALSPIDKLTRLAQHISAEDLSQRLNLQLPDDELGRLASTFDDMTARLEESFRRQRQFTADASHELRTPLTAIKGQVEVALNRPREPGAYREVLQAVNEEVDRMIRLVGSLLTLARADAGQIPLVLEAVDVQELVSAAIEQMRAIAVQGDIDIIASPNHPVTLQGDEGLLLQLLLNLLDNAIRYTPPGGRVEVGWEIDDGQLKLQVRDTGIGVAPEHLPHIFNRFYRADTARRRANGGAGLGLSICRWVAEAHGGSISVASALGEGSTFTVLLPLDGG